MADDKPEPFFSNTPVVKAKGEGVSASSDTLLNSLRNKFPGELTEKLKATNIRVPQPSTIVKRIRTLKADVEDTIKSGEATVVSVAAAAARRRAEEGIIGGTPDSRRKLWVTFAIIGGIILIILGVLGIFYVTLPSSEIKPKTEVFASLIFTEAEKKLDVEARGNEDLLNSLTREREGAIGKFSSIVDIKLIKKDLQSGVESSLTAAEFFDKIKSHAPRGLVRALEPQFMLGIHIFDANQPFFIFKTNSYENAFARMLDWEKDIVKDIGKVLRSPGDFLYATSSEAVLNPRKFEDAVIKNKDVRVLRNGSGKTLILYSFIDRQTLIITTSDYTFGELIERLATTRVVR